MPEARQSSTSRRLLALLAETSVHAGTGAQLGVVDLPIQRERHTEWPTIYGSGLKGVIRDHAESLFDKDDVFAMFGPDTDKGGKGEDGRYAGAMAISDARLLLFPVRAAGVAFAWLSCPLALARLQRDAPEAGLLQMPDLDEAPTAERVLVAPAWPKAEGGVLLEEFHFDAAKSPEVADLGKWIAEALLPSGKPYAYWRDLAASSLVIVSDDDFRDFVRHGTEVVTRVRLSNETKTVAPGALWTEENLPADTLLYSFVAAWRPVANGGTLATAQDVMARLGSLLEQRAVIQVGGKETVGRGFMAARLVGGEHA